MSSSTTPTPTATSCAPATRWSGSVVYRLGRDHITLVHTEVDPAHSGQGHAATLARGALDDARERGLRVVPSCPYVASYIAKHPEYADLVAAS